MILITASMSGTVGRTIKRLNCQNCSENHRNVVLWYYDEVKTDDLVMGLIDLSEERGKLQSENIGRIDSDGGIISRAMQKFPEATIIYFDDENEYTEEKVVALLNEHFDNPQYIISGSRYKINKNGQGIPCFIDSVSGGIVDGFPEKIFRGLGGVLYPPHCLDPDNEGRKRIMREGQYLGTNDIRNIDAYYYMITENGIEFFMPGYGGDREDEAKLNDWAHHDYWGPCIIKEINSRVIIRMILLKRKIR